MNCVKLNIIVDCNRFIVLRISLVFNNTGMLNPEITPFYVLHTDFFQTAICYFHATIHAGIAKT
jgi:hypothetical protein